jgi:hypothetical protein
MGWEQDLEIVIERSGVERDGQRHRYRWLTSDQNPDAWARERYREAMTAQAAQAEAPAPPAGMPPVRRQAANLWRSIRAFVASGGKLAPKSVRAQRLAICRQCEWWNGFRCRKCGCATPIKVWAAEEVCPLDPPKW